MAIENWFISKNSHTQKKTLGRPEENIKIVNYTGSFRPKLDKRFFYPTQCQEWENQISD